MEFDICPVALDAFVFLVNRENKVRDLTREQIRRIYTQRILRWDEVGGAEMPITAFQRDRNSGSQELMRALVMKALPFSPNEADSATQNLVLKGMGGPFLALTSTPGGLGYSIHYYEQFMAASMLTCSIAVDGVVPTCQTIRDRSYPFTTEVYVVIRKGLDDTSPAVRLRDWLLSEEGQAVVRESGYVPILPAAAASTATQK